MRIWKAEEGLGLVAVRSPRTLLISLYNDKNYQCTRINQYEPDQGKTKKNQDLETKNVKREFNNDEGHLTPQNLDNVIEHMNNKLEYLINDEIGDPGRYCYSKMSRAPGSGKLRVG